VAEPTVLQRHLAGEVRAPVGPLDALRAARRRFLAGRRLDMSELAGALGISRATLYRWVGDREQLLGEVLWSFAEAGLEEARAHADRTAKDQGVDWVVRYNAHFVRATAGFEPIRRFLEAEPDAGLRVLTSNRGVAEGRLIESLRATLDERVASGHLKLRLDPGDLAYVIVRISESFIWREFITGDEPDLDRASDVVRVLLT
jgi:AcrR family transcriptional regulator